MKRTVCVILALLLCVGMLAGCGGSTGAAKTEEPAAAPADAGPVEVNVTVWGPQEDQSDDNGKWLQTQCEAFAAAHPEWKINFTYGVCSEGDAKTNIGTDPSAGADVYLFANDQIPDLIKAGG
ncbi:MAG: sugar-binding protein, partial [Oscillospiraceae bacterium]|nr:sugar-binding protein [Oscillospiraceae bacterium]